MNPEQNDKAFEDEEQLGEDLTEVDVGDEPPGDDDSTVWTETGAEEDGEGFDIEIEMDDNGDNEEGGISAGSGPDMSTACFVGHTDCVYSAAIHPFTPGIVLTGGGDDRAFLWSYDANADGSEELGAGILRSKELPGHNDTVTSVGFNYDGKLALTGAYDGKIHIWSVPEGQLQQTLEGPEDIEWAVWHPKGNAVLAGSADGTAWMWLAHNGQCVQVFAGHDGGLTSGLFTCDGKNVITGGEDGTVRVWNPKTGACKHVFEGHSGHEAPVTCLASSADGDKLLSGGVDGKVLLLQISGKRVLRAFDFSTDGKHAASTATAGGDNDNEGEGEGESDTAIECVGFCQAPEFPWAAAGGADKKLRVWDINTGAIRCVCLHQGSVVSMKWHDSLPVVCTAALDCTVRLWDARSGACLQELTGHSDLVTALDMRSLTFTTSTGTTADAEQVQVDVIVSVSDDKTARVFHVSAKDLLP